MNIKDIKCTSLELAKELKEVGYKQEGLWWWITCEVEGEILETTETYLKLGKNVCEKYFVEEFVAPTCSELGERLPNNKILKYIEMTGGFSKTEDKCLVYIIMDLLKDVDAMTEMYIYLNKHNLLDKEE